MKGIWKDAIADLRQGILYIRDRRDRGDPQFFVWVMRMRLGETQAANAELAAYMGDSSNVAPGDWTSKVGNFLLGKISESDFLAAPQSRHKGEERAQRCNVWFYVGMKQLLSGNKPTAADYFQKCRALEVFDSDQYMLAGAELKALSK